MPSPSNAAIAYDNLADRGSIAASSSIVLAPPSTLKDPHVARKWRGAGNSTEFLLADLGKAQPLDTVALMGVNVTEGGSCRVRVSAVDSSAQSGELYDSGVDFGTIDARWDMLVHLLPSVVTGRYVRIDLNQPGAPYIEAGRLFIGQRYQFAYNFAFGWTKGYGDRSRRTESRGGQTYVNRDVTYRVVTVTFDAIPRDQRLGFVEEIDRVNGMHDDVLLITASDSDNLGRDSIWGLLSDLDPVTQPQLWVSGAPAFAKSYKIVERL